LGYLRAALVARGTRQVDHIFVCMDDKIAETMSDGQLLGDLVNTILELGIYQEGARVGAQSDVLAQFVGSYRAVVL
jgi:hypothetical protein